MTVVGGIRYDILPTHARHSLLVPDILFLKLDSSILRESSNPGCGFSMMEQVRLCAVWPTELAWIFLEPHTGL